MDMESRELTVQDGGAVQPATAQGDALLAVIAAAAQDPRVDVQKMQALLDMKLQIVRESAAQEFAVAMSRLQPKLPRIVKNGRIEFNGASQPYAKYEDILKVCRPLLAEEGFSTTYSFEEGPNGTVCICTVTHRGGHSKATRTPPLPMDKSGSKNAVQAVGSMMSYAKRYAFCNAFDIVTTDQDDDGNSTGYLGDEQIQKVYDLVNACEMTTAAQKKLLDFANADSIEHIQKRDYDRVMEALRRKLQNIQRGQR